MRVLVSKSLDFVPNEKGNPRKVLSHVIYDLHFIDIILDALWRTDFRDKSEKWEVSWGRDSRSKVIDYKQEKKLF